MKTGKRIFLKGCALFGLALLASCSSSKDTAVGRGMQNLTARYNILYNARILIDESQRQLEDAYRDDYTRLIPVFKEPSGEPAGTGDKDLDKAIAKLNVIVSEKASSQYVDDAYFLIARANHLKSGFFTAAELFDYLYRSYPDDREKTLMRLAWKARALTALRNYAEAGTALDSAEKYLKPKSKAAPSVYAARAQLYLIGHQDSLAMAYLEKARKLTRDKSLKLRWTFLLAQLRELNGDPASAQRLYTAVIRSNAPFSLAFNAQLNRIALQQENDPRETNGRVSKLTALLKQDKNKAFQDQIYYEIGKAYLGQDDLEKAVESFNRSLQKSTENREQRGLSYLSLAELYFSTSRYPTARLYYDSTLSVLPADHPQYAGIHKKAANLDLLTSQLSVIAREDTLQMLASLPGPDRESRIADLIKMNSGSTRAEPANIAFSPAAETSFQPAVSEGKFYFNNSMALSQGLSEFKRRWGNRKLEDNWRTSQKSSAQMTNISTMAPPSPDDVRPAAGAGNERTADPEALRQEYLRDLPVTPALKAASDRRIENAYQQIAGFYRDILEDRQQAILTYRQLLRRLPESGNRAAVYYNLYRLYSETDSAVRADEIKKILLTQFPGTPYAQTILDPEYGQKQNDREAALNQAYDQAYALFEAGKYDDALSQVSQVKAQFPENRLMPQLAYLEALSTGHLQRLPAFEARLNDIITAFPADSLVTPLVKLHLDYIEKNRGILAARPYAILKADGSESRWVEEPAPETKVVNAADRPVVPKAASAIPENVPVPAGSRFALTDTATCYFVVNVKDGRANLNSSRFGLGQFNRTKFASAAIKHQLKRVNNQNQLIFVGPFRNKAAALAYFREITPLMKQIMKVPADRFNTFIITQEDFGKLEEQEDLDQYIEFYQNTLNERITE
ncbi:MAG TPA: tetratricopeptide repeat protein [Sphingobacteriaceae bacterium]